MSKIKIKAIADSLQRYKQKLRRRKVTPFNGGLYQYDILLLKVKQGKLKFNRFNLPEIHKLIIEAGVRIIGTGTSAFEQDLSKQRCKEQLDSEFYAWVTNKDFEIGIEHSVKEYYPAKDCYKFDVILDQLQPTTSRQIAIVLKLERGFVTPCLSDLEDSRHIRVPFKAKYSITSISVMHNCKINWRSKV